MTKMRRTVQWISCLALVVVAGCGGGGSMAPAGSGGSGNPGSGGTGNPGSGGSGNPGSGGGAMSPLTGNGCAGGKCQNPTCQPLTTAMPLEAFPTIGFEEKPSYIPPNMIIPTFDDVPDGETAPTDDDFKVYGAGKWTQGIVDFLDSKDLHMDFFLNTDNWCGPVKEDQDCINTVGSILRKHNPANHTAHHLHMGIDTPPIDGVLQSCGGASSGVTCDKEMSDVESLVNSISLGGRPHLTRFRAPFGEPYQASGPGLAAVQALVMKYAVEVGWHMDSGDSNCESTTAPCFTGQQIADNVKTLIGTAPGQRYGVLLMHGTFPWTKDAVPILFDPDTGYLAMHGFKLATVEDVICWKYGMHSWDIVKMKSGQDRGPN
jgi:peptidoglycan/xylan/chitin deacetylase (PgdA/CDA1 family)